MKEEKEISFFKKLIISIKDIEKYPELASKTWIKVVSYLLKLLAVFTILISFAFSYTISKEIENCKQFINNDIPDFKIENNELKLSNNEPIIIENQQNIINLIMIDTQDIDGLKLEEYSKKLQDNNSGIVFLKNKFLIKSQVSNGITEYSYNNLLERFELQSIDKQEIISYFSGTNLILIYIGIFILFFIYLFINYMVSIWLDIILLGIFGYITALFMRLHLRFSAMCKIAIHSLTLPILLNALAVLLETFTGFKIKYFEVMYMAIAYIYIVATILIIKSDVIKNQQELVKIIEEQEKVKQEMERQKEEKENSKNEEDKEDKKDDNKEEQKNKDNTDEPQGENA